MPPQQQPRNPDPKYVNFHPKVLFLQPSPDRADSAGTEKERKHKAPTYASCFDKTRRLNENRG
ncbi:hypothetical protein ACJ73_01393 [Blastomyces percursus]|uniref:Uncharacterized protein n=1 Tax=Blastomyces percursus TaxID=1658174 RepID=A0A1J9QFC5_9EURO|nr:hypothetical protein ACJ73_01393 [Blastomyces percursus]